ncbi:MAG: TCR/Tet family MFS transporter [Saprospiraceae bacterium]|nr:TCR/Tet family MFS transporter [Saprospiraceae bacterium]MBK9630820.1 TCR/Tet family MFS transporter [Saprospiraceae bacterium]
MNKAFTFIFLTILIDVTGIGIILPVLPELIQELTGKSLSDASSYAGWMASVYSIMMFFCAPIMGGLSDQFGRRPVLLFSLLGFGLDYILQGFAPSIFWLFIGRILAGITGASFSTAAAFISDLSTPDKKAQNFGLIGAAFGLGFIIGPLLGAFLGQYGVRVPFFGAAALAFMNLIFGFLVLPESLKPENRRAFSWSRANPIGTLRVLTRYSVLKSFIVVLLLIYIAHYSLQSTWTFYTMFKFGWGHDQVGYSLAFVGLMMAIVQGGLSRIIIPKLGPQNSIRFGMIVALLSYMAYAFAPSGIFMYYIMLFFSFSGIAGPSIQGLISNQVPQDAQGELQGGLTALMSISAIFGPLLMTQLFQMGSKGLFANSFPGLPFLVAGILVLIAFLLVQKSLKGLEPYKQSPKI